MDGAAFEAREAARRLARIGFDLHDGPLQEAALLRGELDSVRRLAQAPGDTAALLERLDDLQALATALESELRSMAGSLEGGDVDRRPLNDLLAEAVHRFMLRCDAEVDLAVEGDVDGLPKAHRVAVMRFVQEALTNARQHSGASQVRITVRASERELIAEVADDGRGFEVQSALLQAGRRGSLGLLGMHERARVLGGSCRIRSRPGGGTTVCLRAAVAPAEVVALPGVAPLRLVASA